MVQTTKWMDCTLKPVPRLANPLAIIITDWVTNDAYSYL